MTRQPAAKISSKGGDRSLLKRSTQLIELARKTFALGEEGDSSLSTVPHEITLENFPHVLDRCPIIKKVYTFRVKLYAMEKSTRGGGANLTDGQKMSLLIDSARGISQLARILSKNQNILEKIRHEKDELTREEEDVLDDLTIALSRILLSQNITVKKKKASGKKARAEIDGSANPS
jgi:hypothetical protein